MTVAQTGTVDWLGLEKGTGHVNLTIIDDLDWSSEQTHLLLLQEKLNTYLAFIESGEVFVRVLQELGRDVPRTAPVKVTVLAKFELVASGEAFLAHATETLGDAGISLTHKVVKVP